MGTARLAVVALCVLVALGSGPETALSAVDIRKDDSPGDQVAQGEPDPDDHPTGDGDATPGNDGTGGGDNSYVAPAPAPYYGGGGDGSGTGGT